MGWQELPLSPSRIPSTLSAHVSRFKQRRSPALPRCRGKRCQGCGPRWSSCTNRKAGSSRSTAASSQLSPVSLHMLAFFQSLQKQHPLIMCQVGLNFMTYEAVRTWFIPEGETDPGAIRKLAAGAISGAVAQTCTYPLSVHFAVNSNSCCLTASAVTSSAGDSRSTPCRG